MTANEAIRKIKLALGLEKFAEQSSLADGTIIEANPALEIGAQLSIVGEDGALTPGPEGQHQLEDGRIVVLDAAGVIVEIMEAVAEEAAEDKEEVKEEKMEEMPAEEIVEEAVDMVTEDLISAIVEAIQPMVQEMAKMKEEVVEMKQKFAAFSAEPAAKPVKNNFNAVATPTDKRLEILAQLRKTSKQNK